MELLIRQRVTNHHSELTYYFRIDGELYAGEAQWNDFDGSYTLHTGDEVQVRYDPLKPSRSYFPEKQNVTIATYVLVGLLAILVALAILVLLLDHKVAEQLLT